MKRITIIISLMVLLISCREKSKIIKETEEAHEEEVTNFVSLTDEQMKTGGIELGEIAMKNMRSAVKATGMLSVPNQNKAFVTPLYSGTVRTLLIQPGSYVRKGQLIATIINPDIVQLQQQLISVNAEISMAELEEKRQRELIAGNAAPLKNLQQAQTRLKTLRSERAGIQKQLSTLGISGNRALTSTLSVLAPISGTVSTVQAQIGSNVDPSVPIAEIVNNSQLHLDLFVYEKDLPKLKKDQLIHFTLTNNPGKEYDAQIYSIGTAFAAQTKTIPVHAVVKGDKTGLIEGMNITALISVGFNEVPAVPDGAIVSSEGLDFIFVKSNDFPEKNHEPEAKESHENEEHIDDHKTADSAKAGIIFEKIQVIKGVSDVGYTEIKMLKEISIKTPIITKGAFFVLSMMSNTGGEHAH